ncbi:class II fructose-bisphosphate aldolase [Crassaminicella thermophila]|uniref:Class II fructose-bisphosphate aldolase n=1 Tax=Crassaminicella thermophila TaxID=2599308 RepID=A0A5C0SCG1_CRATE|nr:class II fructose-bisphosphate aldolase [Crassaminicella thermophila]QEK11602.1 class II fructose-bisphosphate aldolase [Crassaminicella thermophila]
MLVNLKEALKGVAKSDFAIPGFNVFGYEDAVAVVRAAEELDAPVILMTNKVAVNHMPIEILAKILCAVAEDAKVPVCVHLDHATEFEVVARAIKAGYTSVMYDGSQLPFEENIKNTREIVRLAHACNVSVEAEIGAVGYSDPSLKVKARYTEPEEAKIFAEKTGVDALAVAIGTLHRMETQDAVIQYDRLEAIEKLTDVPLVIHGSTGVKDEDLKKLSRYNVAKVNIGTALRMVFGNTMREEMNKNPNEFDRIVLFQKPMVEVQKEAKKKMELLGIGKK